MMASRSQLALWAGLVGHLVSASAEAWEDASPNPCKLRVATFNAEDLHREDTGGSDHPRLRALAKIIQELQPNVLLLNEIAFDDAAGDVANVGGSNGQRFADHYLAISQEEALPGIRYQAFMAPVNTGLSSGFDLDNNGRAVTDAPATADRQGEGSTEEQTQQAREYGNDCWGFGAFPGQYGMALLVREGAVILRDRVRTFRQLPWRAMPGALIPRHPDTGRPWYNDQEWERFPLSSKSHWDVPVQAAGGVVVHFLCSHPTPPVFDGEEDRNGCRNHDEIRFWADYLRGADYIVDDKGARGGLEPGASFVILGDLNADPDEGDGRGNPVGSFLLSHPRIQGGFVPKAAARKDDAQSKLDPDDTAIWGLRVDYVLPSVGLCILDGGVVRHQPGGVAPSDHLPVWLDLVLPPTSDRSQKFP